MNFQNSTSPIQERLRWAVGPDRTRRRAIIVGAILVAVIAALYGYELVRELRTRDRIVSALRVFGVVTAVALAGFLFLRLDEWSKGYLTSWLAFIAASPLSSSLRLLRSGEFVLICKRRSKRSPT